MTQRQRVFYWAVVVVGSMLMGALMARLHAEAPQRWALLQGSNYVSKTLRVVSLKDSQTGLCYGVLISTVYGYDVPTSLGAVSCGK